MQPMPITEHACVSDTVSASPEDCFRVASAIADYPSWVPAITSVEVREADEAGRVLVAAFRAEAMGRHTSYVLRYDYGTAPGSFSWSQIEGDLTRRMNGSYSFKASGDEPGATLVTYELDLELAMPLPGFVKRRAETKIVQAALTQFRVRAESLGTPSG